MTETTTMTTSTVAQSRMMSGPDHDSSSFLIGPPAKRQLRNLLRTTTDPASTLSNFQTHNSLYACMAKSLGTTAMTEGMNPPSSSDPFAFAQSQKNTTPRFEEPLQPESALTFVGHLGVSRYEVHKAFGDALRLALQEEIQNAASARKEKGVHPALISLLHSCWKWVEVPEIHPIILQLVKTLGEEGIPLEFLRDLARKKDLQSVSKEKYSEVSKILKYADLYEQLSIEMKQLVWEADWSVSYRGDGTWLGSSPITISSQLSSSLLVNPHVTLENIAGTLHCGNLFAETIRPIVMDYVHDAQLVRDANLCFVPGIREKKIATTARRVVPSHAATLTGTRTNATTSSAVSSSHTKLSGLLGNESILSLSSTAGSSQRIHGTSRQGQGESFSHSHSEPSGVHKIGDNNSSFTKNTSDGKRLSSAAAVEKINEMIRNRPKLLGAFLNMLIAEHGLHYVLRNNNPVAVAFGPSSDDSIIAGSSYLTCTLVSDVLLSYGQLPRQYETLGILANILDTAVKNGFLSDQTLAQIQGCLRDIFPSARGGTDAVSPVSMTATGAAVSKVSTINNDTVMSQVSSSLPDALVEQNFEMKLIRKIVVAAVNAMKECDPQNLFLNPVTDHIAPGYSSIIKNPMCIRVMEDKAVNQKYRSLGEYEEDVKLIFSNCITYNIGKEGQWFRGEAKRQQKIWQDEIIMQARDLYKNEMSKRKKALERAGTGNLENSESEDKKRKRDILEIQRELANRSGIRAGAGASVTSSGISGDDDTISKMTAQDVKPLTQIVGRRRKKDYDFPSPHALVSMLLADPFVIRLLIDKAMRSLKSDVLKEKSLPASDLMLPSILQLLYLAYTSTQLCAGKGRKFALPGISFKLTCDNADDDDTGQRFTELTHASLRKYSPLIMKLLVQVDLDRRMTIGGDLYDAAFSFTKVSTEEWSSGACPVIRALVQAAMIETLQPGNSNEKALQTQLQRFNTVLQQLLKGANDDRAFYNSLIAILLRHKSKLPHSTRDLVATIWLSWFGERSMTAPVHECFIELLNEWRCLGNVLLPRDKMLSLASDAIAVLDSKDKYSFNHRWVKNEQDFCAIKLQYERMLKTVTAESASKWKQAMNIEEISSQAREKM